MSLVLRSGAVSNVYSFGSGLFFEESMLFPVSLSFVARRNISRATSLTDFELASLARLLSKLDPKSRALSSSFTSFSIIFERERPSLSAKSSSFFMVSRSSCMVILVLAIATLSGFIKNNQQKLAFNFFIHV